MSTSASGVASDAGSAECAVFAAMPIANKDAINGTTNWRAGFMNGLNDSRRVGVLLWRRDGKRL
jgi:hypothetical protein